LIAGGIILPIAYPGIVKIFPVLLLKLGGPSPAVNLVIFIVILLGLIYLSYWAKQNKKPILNISALCMVFALIGFTTYAMIIIRSNQQTPMNENEPKDFTKLVYYLGREQYGDFPILKRRFSNEPHQQGIYTEYSSDLDYLWKYQINHMYNRYLLWNFVGREGSEQDAGVNFNDFFAIPLLMGLLGLYFQFRKDWKMASAFVVLFVFMGYLIAFYQNQQEPQPRERDYFYGGALFVFCLWIAAGINGLAELVKEKVQKKQLARGLSFAVVAAALLLIPVRMLAVNYHSHDRSKDWLPWDLSYNLLQSCAPNAVLFTNGDNDTFPLWYLQYVEGIRRDVRIVCLSLANTNWYVSQLKNTEPYGNPKVKFSLTDDQIENLNPVAWRPTELTLPVPRDAGAKTGITDSSVVREGKITFKMNPTLGSADAGGIMAQDIVVREIVMNNAWDRPIYFASTVPYESRIGLDDYLRLEGLALRLVPQKKPVNSDFLDEPIMRKQLFEENPSYSATYQPGFKFRGLNDRSIYFEKDTHTRMAQSYRSSFLQLAVYYLNVTNQKDMVIKTLDEMEKKVPREVVDIDFRHLITIGNIYLSAGANDRYAQIAKEIEPIAWRNMSTDAASMQNPYNSFRVLEDLYVNLKQYDKAIEVLKRLQAAYPDDPGIQSEIARISKLKGM
ncbi:MAG: tetratricopeptide repeat protein, partial [Syntrophothermus sp.]